MYVKCICMYLCIVYVCVCIDICKYNHFCCLYVYDFKTNHFNTKQPKRLFLKRLENANSPSPSRL